MLGRQPGDPLAVLAHERLDRLAERLPVRVGAERLEAGQGSHARPVGDPLHAAGERQQADDRARALARHVGDQVGDEVDQARLAEGQHLVVELLRHLAAEALGAVLAVAAPVLAGQAEVLGVHPVRLVPEDPVGAGLDRGVGPLAAERAHARVVGAAGGRAAAGLQHLTDLRVVRGEAALGLAAEHLAHAPRRDLDLEPGGVRGGRRAAPSSRGSRRGRSR